MATKQMPALDGACKVRAAFECFYRGWDRAGIGRPCRPPALLSEEMKRVYVEGYRARKEIE